MATLLIDLDPLVRERWLRLPPSSETLIFKHCFMIFILSQAYLCVSLASKLERLEATYERFQMVRVLAVAYIWRLMQCTLLGQNKVPPLYYLRRVLPFYDLPITLLIAAFYCVTSVIAKSLTAYLVPVAYLLLWIIMVVYELPKLKQYKMVHQQNNDAANNSVPFTTNYSQWKTLYPFDIQVTDHFAAILLAALCVDLVVQLESLVGISAAMGLGPLLNEINPPSIKRLHMRRKSKGSPVYCSRRVVLCYNLPIIAAITVFYSIVRTFPKTLVLVPSMQLIHLASIQCETEDPTGAAEVGAVSSSNTDLVHQQNYDAPHSVASTSKFTCDDPIGGSGFASVYDAHSRDDPISFVAAQLRDWPLREHVLRLSMPSFATLVSSFAPVFLVQGPKGTYKSLELCPELTGFAVVQLSKRMHIRWAKHKRPHGYCSGEVEGLYRMTFTVIIVLSIVLRLHSKSLFVAYGLSLHLLNLIVNSLDLYVFPREAVHEIQGVEPEQNISRNQASSLKTVLVDQQNYDVAHSISSTTNFRQCETVDPTGAAEVASVSSNIDELVDQRNYDYPQSFSSPLNFSQRPKWDPPPGDEGFASVHAASSRALSAVEEDDDDDVNSTSDAANFSRWEKGEILGHGAFGTVCVAYNREIKKFCAVKELKDIFKLEQIESIKKEIEILSQLKHPNIVKYYGNEIVGHHIYLHMEYIPPGSLKKYISERGVLCESLIQNFTVQILSGLVYLHSRRVVHRDIKPDNLLVDSNNIVKLVDFGLAKHLGESVGKHSQLGTPYYASPEVLQKLEYESSREASAADIWSLGCVIIEMFSGKHPWPRLEWQQAFYRVCLKEEHPDIPEELCQDGKDFLQLCFRRTPAERPSAVALLDHPFVKAKTT